MKYFRLVRFKTSVAICAYCGRNLGTVSEGYCSRRCPSCGKTTIFSHGESTGWR